MLLSLHSSEVQKERTKTMFQIKKGMYGASNSRTVRFPEALFERLCQLAQENGISFNFLVLQCCHYALTNMENSNKTSEDTAGFCFM